MKKENFFCANTGSFNKRKEKEFEDFTHYFFILEISFLRKKIKIEETIRTRMSIQVDSNKENNNY